MNLLGTKRPIVAPPVKAPKGFRGEQLIDVDKPIRQEWLKASGTGAGVNQQRFFVEKYVWFKVIWFHCYYFNTDIIDAGWFINEGLIRTESESYVVGGPIWNSMVHTDDFGLIPAGVHEIIGHISDQPSFYVAASVPPIYGPINTRAFGATTRYVPIENSKFYFGKHTITFGPPASSLWGPNTPIFHVRCCIQGQTQDQT